MGLCYSKPNILDIGPYRMAGPGPNLKRSWYRSTPFTGIPSDGRERPTVAILAARATGWNCPLQTNWKENFLSRKGERHKTLNARFRFHGAKLENSKCFSTSLYPDQSFTIYQLPPKQSLVHSAFSVGCLLSLSPSLACSLPYTAIKVAAAAKL